jgi:hypothetical protein
MTSVFPARRRAEEFAVLVDGGGGRTARHDDLLEVVAALRDAPPVEARPEFVSGLRTALMAEADVALAHVDTRLTLPSHPRTRRDRRWAIAAGTVALIGASSSMAVASQNALPGDALYPIKRVIEGAQSALQVDQIDKGEVLLDTASGRLDEVSALRARNTAEGNAALAGTLDDFSDEAGSAADVLLEEYDSSGDTATIEKLRSFTHDSMDTLVALGEDLPSSARTSLEHAARVVKDIDDRAAAACPSCGGGIDELPAMFVRSLSDGVTDPSTTVVAPPVVISPDPKDGSDPAPSTGDDGGDAPTSQPGDGSGSTTDDPTGSAGDTLQDLTKKLLGGGGSGGSGSGGTGGGGTDQPTSSPDLGDVTDPLLDPVIGDGGLLNP